MRSFLVVFIALLAVAFAADQCKAPVNYSDFCGVSKDVKFCTSSDGLDMAEFTEAKYNTAVTSHETECKKSDADKETQCKQFCPEDISACKSNFFGCDFDKDEFCSDLTKERASGGEVCSADADCKTVLPCYSVCLKCQTAETCDSLVTAGSYAAKDVSDCISPAAALIPIAVAILALLF